MKNLLSDTKYDFVSEKDKAFVTAFDEAMKGIGYENSGIVPYVVFGKYKIEYSRAGLKNKKFVARFYFRDDRTLLRMYFTNVEKHREYIENAPGYIKEAFINNVGPCKHCENGFNKDGKCNFRKSYTIDGKAYEKCGGENFFFINLDLENVPEYLKLLTEFYPNRKRKDGALI